MEVEETGQNGENGQLVVVVVGHTVSNLKT